MSQDAAHHSIWQTSDAIFGVAFLLALGLSFLFPLLYPVGFPKILLYVVGSGLVLIGLRFVFLSRSFLRRDHQPSHPGIPTTKLVTDGVFSVSRNPSYLGLAIAFAGLGILLSLPWMLIVLFPTIVVTHFVLIIPEERYLEGKFGEEFRQYRQSVRRWI